MPSGQQRAHDLLDVVADDRPGQDAVELLDHRRPSPSWSPGTRTPRPASSPSVATSTSADQLAAPGHAVPAGGQREPARAELAQLLGDLGRRRGQRHVAQLEGRGGGSAGAVVAGRRRRPRLGGPGAGGRHCLRPARPARRRRAAPPCAARPSSSRSGRRSPRPSARSHPPSVSWSTSTVERHVAHERDDAGVGAGQLLVRGQVLAQLGRLLVEVGEDRRRGRRTWSAAWPPSSPPRRARPGRLSEGSPRSAASSTYCDGGTPVRSKMPASS